MSHYKTKLARDIQLDVNEWEVGLVEFIYPISWYNLMNGSFSVRKLVGHRWNYFKGQIPDNRYNSAKDVIKILEQDLNTILDSQANKYKFTFLQTRHMKVYVADGYGIKLSPNLARALGFGDHDKMCELRNYTAISDGTETCDIVKTMDRNTLISPFIADVHRGLRSLFIHCNIVEPQLVGDQFVPLMRTIAVRGQTDDVVAKSFPNIHYMSIERSVFQEIEIHIKTI